MGIINTTPDSFYDGGKYNSVEKALRLAERHLKEGATILDIGGYSSRPGANNISIDEELKLYGSDFFTRFIVLQLKFFISKKSGLETLVF